MATHCTKPLQHWLFISEILRNPSQWVFFSVAALDINIQICLKIYTLKMESCLNACFVVNEGTTRGCNNNLCHYQWKTKMASWHSFVFNVHIQNEMKLSRCKEYSLYHLQWIVKWSDLAWGFWLPGMQINSVALVYTCCSLLLGHLSNRPVSQIPQCTCSISHNAPFRTEMCTFLFWMVHCGIWNRCIVGFVR